MYLKDLVGKLAIRTSEPYEQQLEFAKIAPRIGAGVDFRLSSEKTKYMEEPVRIINAKENQVVIEDVKDGRRKLLERKYIDSHWEDYEALLHPEDEEKKKAEDMAKEIRAAAEPLRRFLEKYYDPMVKVTVDEERVVVERGEFQTAFWEDKEEDKE